MFDVRRVGLMLDDDPDEAFRLCNDHLREQPNDAKALFLVGIIMSRAERYSAALPIFERCTRLAPQREEAWNSLGMALQECDQYTEARDAFKRALALKPKAPYMANLAATYLAEGNFSEAKRWCRKALDQDQDHIGALSTMGFACLALGDYAQGWAGYEHCLPGRFRKELQFGDEPRWDGSPVETLVVYGEQGLGDEIMYASILGDAQRVAKHITLECDERLEGLFKRSFPEIEVHGTRRHENPAWAVKRKFDARCATGSLASLFRTSAESFPRRPYLKADPERRLQWRALFDSWGKKPVIGLAWTGGRASSQQKERKVGLEALRSYIARTDAHFVSLQYKDADEEIAASGLPVRHIKRAVQSPDYCDTAAFVAELDHIVGPPTTVHHLAGALGVPSTILVPSRPMWNVAHGDRLPWNAEQVYHRQRAGEDWTECVKRMP